MSYLASTMTNLAISVHGKKGAKLTEVKDFLLDWDTKKPKKGTQTVEDIKRIFSAFGAKNKGREKRDIHRKPKSLQK